ncbi:MAG: putative molybdenum carrier protein [Proteobacteria bacterium]|nr:putative molybdenum carrier protein [Pseudomonadota bacterium]
MLNKIISGGQTGVERAALDVAIKLDLAHGGWISNEDGPISEKYKLKETESPGFKIYTEQNVIDSDGILIISHGKLTDDFQLTQKYAKDQKKSCLHMDLNKINSFKAANDINIWVQNNDIEVLNVTGPSANKDPAIYMIVSDILEAAIYLNIMNTNMFDNAQKKPGKSDGTDWIGLPKTVEEVLDTLISIMPLKDKITLANMTDEELGSLNSTLGLFLRNNYRLWGANTELLESCRIISGEKNIDTYKASSVIIFELWKILQKTHKLRVIK